MESQKLVSRATSLNLTTWTLVLFISIWKIISIPLSFAFELCFFLYHYHYDYHNYHYDCHDYNYGLTYLGPFICSNFTCTNYKFNISHNKVFIYSYCLPIQWFLLAYRHLSYYWSLFSYLICKISSYMYKRKGFQYSFQRQCHYF